MPHGRRTGAKRLHLACPRLSQGSLRKAAMHDGAHGVVDHWLSDIRTVIRWHRAELEAIQVEQARVTRLAELNVLQQLGILARTPVVLDSWARGQPLMLQGLVYEIGSGRLRPVAETVNSSVTAEHALPHV